MEAKKSIGFFEKYLTLWVLLCIGVGIAVGIIGGDSISTLSEINISTVNIPVAILVWAMIFPMMVQIDFSSIKHVARDWKGLGLTVFINWIVKPFSMALFGYIFFYHIFQAWITPELADQYIAGAILLGAAPCTAMVFVWSYLSDGDPTYTLIQVSVNDLILLIAFVPIVAFLFHAFGISAFEDGQAIGIPYDALITSVVVFVVIPLLAGWLINNYLRKKKGEEWFKLVFLKALKPISTVALLLTLILLFAFQGEQITADPLAILLIAIPLTIQTYFIFFLSWFIGRKLKLSHAVCAPAAMIGASNFFELAVAVAISLFGLESGASLATVVGVLIEVPVMLSLVALANRWKY